MRFHKYSQFPYPLVNPETGEEEATYKENDLLDDILPDIPHYCLLIKG